MSGIFSLYLLLAFFMLFHVQDLIASALYSSLAVRGARITVLAEFYQCGIHVFFRLFLDKIFSNFFSSKI